MVFTYTLDYYINYEYNTYTNLIPPPPPLPYKRQVSSYVISMILFT